MGSTFVITCVATLICGIVTGQLVAGELSKENEAPSTKNSETDPLIDACGSEPSIADGSPSQASTENTSTTKASTEDTSNSEASSANTLPADVSSTTVKPAEDGNQTESLRAPRFCFQAPNWRAKSGYWTRKRVTWFYSPRHHECHFFFSGVRARQKENRFETEEECNRVCRDPDLGVCAPPRKQEPCEEGTERLRYRFDARRKICMRVRTRCSKGQNIFSTITDCYQNCGKYVVNWCNIPIIQRTCANRTTKYGYNRFTGQCEEFEGCAEDGGYFHKAKHCWRQCADWTRSPCLRPRWWYRAFGKTRYHYDIETNQCVETKAKWSTLSERSNLFMTQHDCERICKPKHSRAE